MVRNRYDNLVSLRTLMNKAAARYTQVSGRAYWKVDKLFVQGTDAMKARSAIEVTIEALKALDTNKHQMLANFLGYVADYVDPQRKADRNEDIAFSQVSRNIGKRGKSEEKVIEEASEDYGVPTERLRKLLRNELAANQ